MLTVADLEPAVTLLEEHGYLRSYTPPRLEGGARMTGDTATRPGSPPRKPQNPRKPPTTRSGQR